MFHGVYRRQLLLGCAATLLIICSASTLEHVVRLGITAASQQLLRSDTTGDQPALSGLAHTAGQGGTVRSILSLRQPVTALTTSVPVAATGSNLSTSTKYYQISGKTAADLAAQINSLGPAVSATTHYAANTSWLITWSYRYQALTDGCMIATAQVAVKITYIYPRWADAATASPDIATRWRQFMAALEVHEQGHGRLAIAAGDEVLHTLLTLPPAESCAMLGQQADTASNAVLARHNLAQTRYDDETRHGETQGAIW